MKLTYPACFYKDEEGSEGYAIEVPAYLNAFAESQHINYSQLLQEDLAEKHRQQYAEII